MIKVFAVCLLGTVACGVDAEQETDAPVDLVDRAVDTLDDPAIDEYELMEAAARWGVVSDLCHTRSYLKAAADTKCTRLYHHSGMRAYDLHYTYLCSGGAAKRIWFSCYLPV